MRGAVGGMMSILGPAKEIAQRGPDEGRHRVTRAVAVAADDLGRMGRAGDFVQPEAIAGGVAVRPPYRGAAGIDELVEAESLDVALWLDFDDRHPDRWHRGVLEARQAFS